MGLKLHRIDQTKQLHCFFFLFHYILYLHSGKTTPFRGHATTLFCLTQNFFGGTVACPLLHTEQRCKNETIGTAVLLLGQAFEIPLVIDRIAIGLSTL